MHLRLWGKPLKALLLRTFATEWLSLELWNYQNLKFRFRCGIIRLTLYHTFISMPTSVKSADLSCCRLRARQNLAPWSTNPLWWGNVLLVSADRLVLPLSRPSGLSSSSSAPLSFNFSSTHSCRSNMRWRRALLNLMTAKPTRTVPA